jgi:hypothetical protein
MMSYWKKVLLPGLVGGLAVMASAVPAGAAGDGPINTPLAPFTDGSLGKYLWTVPGVVKKQGFVTEVTCTNLDAPGTTADIGVEIFDETGTQLNNISVAPAPGACNGAMLGVPAGHTVTIASGATAQFHEDCIIAIAAGSTGSARVLSTSSKIMCTALIADSKNVVLTSGGFPTGVSPAVASLKMIRRNKQQGD